MSQRQPAELPTTARRFARTGLLAIQPAALQGLFNPCVVPTVVLGTTAIVSVTGPLVNSAGEWEDSYDSIRKRIQLALAEPTVRDVVVKYDSPGGDVAGCFSTARAIRSDFDAAGKRYIAYVAGTCCSAAYGLASPADVIVVEDTSLVGSLGVLDVRVDTSQADEAIGIRTYFVTSGAQKAYGHPQLPMSPEELVASQTIIDSMAQSFFALVSEFRSVSVDKLSGMQAAVFTGPAAVAAQLADSQMSFDALLARLATGDFQKMDSLESVAAALQGLLESGADDSTVAKVSRMLQAMSDEPPAAETPPPDEDEPDGDEPPADEDDKDETKAKKAKSAIAAQVSAGTAADLVTMVQGLAAEVKAMRAERESQTVKSILASRADLELTDEVKKLLASKPAADVKAILAGIKPKTAKVQAITTLAGPQPATDPAVAGGLHGKDAEHLRLVMGVSGAEPTHKSTSYSQVFNRPKAKV